VTAIVIGKVFVLLKARLQLVVIGDLHAQHHIVPGHPVETAEAVTG
jgi:hypothetical protein